MRCPHPVFSVQVITAHVYLLWTKAMCSRGAGALPGGRGEEEGGWVQGLVSSHHIPTQGEDLGENGSPHRARAGLMRAPCPASQVPSATCRPSNSVGCGAQLAQYRSHVPRPHVPIGGLSRLPGKKQTTRLHQRASEHPCSFESNDSHFTPYCNFPINCDLNMLMWLTRLSIRLKTFRIMK